jgi:hypothetical protein
LEEVLGDEGLFEVIVSFETVEHLAQPERLLGSISNLRAPGSVVAISCPNDHAFGMDKGGNPFHLNHFTFEEFKAFTERHLGPASVWLLGAPVQGELNYAFGDRNVTHGRADAIAITDSRGIDNALLLPAQNGLEVSPAISSHYVGVWGGDVRPNIVVSAQSVPSVREPWIALDWFKGRERDYFEPEIVRLNAAIAEYEKTKREWYEPELKRLGSALDDTLSRCQTAQSDHVRSQAEAEEARRRIQEYFEPEIARLNTLIGRRERDRQELSREVQDQRARVLYYADQVAVLAGQIDQHEKTKPESFEPQLNELEQRLSTLAQFESSRGYRAWRKYQELYNMRLIGPLLRKARRIVGALLHRR